MRLTQENVHLYEGKILDVKRRLHHHYPLAVKRNRLGELMLVDCTGTYMKIPAENDLHNEVYFDFVLTLQIEKMRLGQKKGRRIL